MERNRSAWLGSGILACVLLAAPATALEDPAKGKRLAERWCSPCHLVSSTQENAQADVPPFATIAKRSDDELDALRGFLVDPHPPMPNMSLTRQEITDVIAYIRSLR